MFTRCDRRGDQSRARSLRRSHRVNKALRSVSRSLTYAHFEVDLYSSSSNYWR